MSIRKTFRCVFMNWDGTTLSTGIAINVPSGLARQEAIDFVTGACAREIARYAASEALNLGPYSNDTDWSEKVT